MKSKNTEKTHANYTKELASIYSGRAYFYDTIKLYNDYINKLEMCSVSTNGERASPAQEFQVIGCNFSYNN